MDGPDMDQGSVEVTYEHDAITRPCASPPPRDGWVEMTLARPNGDQVWMREGRGWRGPPAGLRGNGYTALAQETLAGALSGLEAEYVGSENDRGLSRQTLCVRSDDNIDAAADSDVTSERQPEGG
jgi:hypothetical protein